MKLASVAAAARSPPRRSHRDTGSSMVNAVPCVRAADLSFASLLPSPPAGKATSRSGTSGFLSLQNSLVPLRGTVKRSAGAGGRRAGVSGITLDGGSLSGSATAVWGYKLHFGGRVRVDPTGPRPACPSCSRRRPGARRVFTVAMNSYRLPVRGFLSAGLPARGIVFRSLRHSSWTMPEPAGARSGPNRNCFSRPTAGSRCVLRPMSRGMLLHRLRFRHLLAVSAGARAPRRPIVTRRLISCHTSDISGGCIARTARGQDFGRGLPLSPP